MSAAFSRSLAVGEFWVMGEVVGQDEVEHRDGEQSADLQGAEGSVEAILDQRSRKREEHDGSKPQHVEHDEAGVVAPKWPEDVLVNDPVVGDYSE
jgi:hypothetical protein